MKQRQQPSRQQRLRVSDTVLLGEWKEVSGLPLSSVTKRDTDTDTLDGLVIRGYETKFGVTNENGERYAPGCLDRFVNDYFVEHGLNMVVDLQHSCAVDDQVGRVIYLEVNTVGFYFVAYVPRSVKRYQQVKDMLREGILQGFSKCGWATDWEWKCTEDGELDHMLIKEMAIMSVSLVTNPANPIPFEEVGETVKDRLEFRNFTAQPEPEPEPQPERPSKRSIFR